MQRIQTLLQKINELAIKDKQELIDIDLMLDYIRVIYADLSEMRGRMYFNESLVKETPVPQQHVIEKASPPQKIEPVEDIQEKQVAEPWAPALAVPPAGPSADIRALIGINDKYQFISELFGNNKEAYETMLSRINTFETYETAIDWLDTDVHSIYNWDDENETVSTFYSVLSQFFESR